MTLPQLQREIVSCLWSAGLKQCIADRGYTFSGKELLGIAFHFAPSFAERLRLLGLLADHAPSVADHAARCIDWLEKCLEQFRRVGDHELYELRIKDTPDAYEERYLCDTFDTALEMIDQFYAEYDFAPETPQARYVIEKRRILQSCQSFREDSMGECVLLAGKVLLSVDAPPHETENGACGGHCTECPNPCVSDLEIQFPTFIDDRAPVQYRLYDGSLHYGIHLAFSPSETQESYYIIPLDGEMLKSRDYDKYWTYHWHEHILCPDVDTIPASALDANLRENYHAFVAWLDKDNP